MLQLAVRVFAEGAVSFLRGSGGGRLDYQLSCESNQTRYLWGDTLLRLPVPLLPKSAEFTFPAQVLTERDDQGRADVQPRRDIAAVRAEDCQPEAQQQDQQDGVGGGDGGVAARAVLCPGGELEHRDGTGYQGYRVAGRQPRAAPGIFFSAPLHSIRPCHISGGSGAVLNQGKHQSLSCVRIATEQINI